MAFPTESSGYEKTILSDLQGAWILLRESVVEVETINVEDASGSPYANALKINFDASPDFKHLVLYQKHMQAGRA
jgi:hypothetical protein